LSFNLPKPTKGLDALIALGFLPEDGHGVLCC